MAQRALLMFLAICLANPLYAGPEETTTPADGVRIEIATVPEEVARELAQSVPGRGPSVEELRDLNREAHETLEGDEDERPWWRKLFSWSSWKEKLNFRRTFVNASRWFALRGGDVRTHEHVVNLIIMYSASHVSESVIGTAAASWAVDPANTAHWAVKTMATVAGVTIVIPGLDPICLSLGYLYYRFPRVMHTILTPPRFLVVRVIFPVAKVTGIQAIAQWVGSLLVASEEGSTFLRRVLEADTTGIYRWTPADGGYDVTVLDAEGEAPLARMVLVDDGNGGLGLKTLDLWTKSAFDRARVEKALGSFGYNIRSAVLEASDALRAGREEALAKRVYVASVTNVGDATRVAFQTEAVRLGRARRFRPWPYLKAAAVGCAHVLAGGGPPLMPPRPK